MIMESSGEIAVAVAVASYSSNGSSGVECDYAAAVASFAKRKRTKRLLRTSSSPASPPPPPPNEGEDYFSTSTTTEEEEDMAHCLILLAQGRTAGASPSPSPPLPPREEKFTSRKFAETTTTATGAKAGFYVYECKTCNKCFPSFQALGGHRASHKKPKLAAAATAVKADVDHDGLEISMNSSFAKTTPTTAPAPAPAPAPPNKLRVHECSICGSEFASGQALGGHMRRHRPVGAVPPAAAAAESPELLANCSGTKKEEEEENKCMMLSLDLNLPAPSEENPMAVAFAGFAVDQRPLALVDCHY